MALQLLMDVGKIRRGLTAPPRSVGVVWKQPSLQIRFGHLRRKRPTQSRRTKTLYVLVHRALADVGAAGDLPLPQLQLEIQPKDFSRLTHGHSLSRHRSPLPGATVPAVWMSSAATLVSHL